MNTIPHHVRPALASASVSAAQGLRRATLARWRACAATLAGLVLTTAQAAEPSATLTLLEGPATVIVGARALVAAPGARLAAGTLIETEASTGLLRLEWPDGAVLDLGPATRVVLQPAVGNGRAPLFYLLQGWAKQTQSKVAAGQWAAAFDVAPFAGVLVSQVDEGQAVLFSEAGGGPFLARRQGSSLTLKPGETAVLSGAQVPQITPRPPAAWIKQLPASFRETLSPMASKFKGPAPILRPKGALSYAALQPWLVAEPLLRRDFPQRFAELLRDPLFRQAVASRLAQHPEWDAALKPPRPGAAARKNNDTSDQEPKR